VLGSISFSLKDLIEKGSKDGGYYQWQNIYGTPVEVRGSIEDEMNLNPEFASTMKGKILIQVEAHDVDHPEKKVCKSDVKIRKKAKE